MKGNSLKFLAMMSVLGAANPVTGRIMRDDRLRKGNPEPTEAERQQMKGLKEFHFKGGSVWALNQKNADKKAKKLGIY